MQEVIKMKGSVFIVLFLIVCSGFLFSLELSNSTVFAEVGFDYIFAPGKGCFDK